MSGVVHPALRTSPSSIPTDPAQAGLWARLWIKLWIARWTSAFPGG